MLNILHAEWQKMVGNRWTIGLLLWVFPVGALAFVVGMSLMALLSPTARDNLYIIPWTEAFLVPWRFVNNPFGLMFLLGFTAVTFAGEYQWGTWKNIVTRQQRTLLIMAKFTNLGALILIAFILTSLIFGGGFGIFSLIADVPYEPAATGEIVQEFLRDYALETALAFISIIITAVYAALAAIVMQSILGGTLVGIGFSLIDPLIFGMIWWWANLFNTVSVLHLGRISLFYNIENIKSWIRDDQAVATLESAFQTFNKAAPIDSIGFSMLALAVWLLGGVGLVLYLFQRQDITT
ncbi:MAG: hypothetical protein KC413_15465 [Anaerolineales bacterium]|nr:hypothetical protein [Anaerolineales bacterium]MCB8966391.1 hypothetical protein [Ardenticatenaceae bacterium]